MRRRLLLLLAAVLAVLTAGFLLGPRPAVDTTLHPQEMPAEPEALAGWVAEREARLPDIIPRTEKVVVWADPTRHERTSLAVVYLHGFSATRQEIAPVPEMVARNLQANLFCTRLTGHGRPGDAMGEASVNAWLNDAHEALEIGRRLGEQVVLIGTSTGGTLATWMAATAPDDLATLVLVSPNFRPRDPAAGILLLPWGELLARAVVGEYRSWEPHNEAQGRYWSTRYPSAALVPMMALVDLVEEVDLGRIQTPSLVFYSKEDQVIDPERVEAAFGRIGAGRKVLVPVEGDGDPSHHVLAGEILSPDTVGTVVQRILGFVRGNR